jgi:hypothetical protein
MFSHMSPPPSSNPESDIDPEEFLEQVRRRGSPKKESVLTPFRTAILAAKHQGQKETAIMETLREEYGVSTSLPNLNMWIRRQTKPSSAILPVAGAPAASGDLKQQHAAQKPSPASGSPKLSPAPISKTTGKTKKPSGRIALPETGAVPEAVWTTFAKQEHLPVEPEKQNFLPAPYAEKLGQNGVQALNDDDYFRLAGYIYSWRVHPSRMVSDDWSRHVKKEAHKIKTIMRRTVGLT